MNKSEMKNETDYRLLKRTLLVIFAVLGLFILLWKNGVITKKYTYKIPYEKNIVEASTKNSVDEHLVAAVIKNESKFIPSVKSRAGAVGLMQIMPSTGKWIATEMGRNNFKVDELQEPKTSIDMGCWYLAKLAKQFKGNAILMLIAYNAGPGNAKEWMEKNNWDYNFSNIDEIPYPETKIYVSRVMKDRNRYFRIRGS